RSRAAARRDQTPARERTRRVGRPDRSRPLARQFRGAVAARPWRAAGAAQADLGRDGPGRAEGIPPLSPRPARPLHRRQGRYPRVAWPQPVSSFLRYQNYLILVALMQNKPIFAMQNGPPWPSGFAVEVSRMRPRFLRLVGSAKARRAWGGTTI